jgi:hypothetical protein
MHNREEPGAADCALSNEMEAAPKLGRNDAKWAARRDWGRTMSKAKKWVFSVVKAVKSNARDRVGTPPPERVLPDPKQKAAAKPKHKKTLADLLSRQDGDAV